MERLVLLRTHRPGHMEMLLVVACICAALNRAGLPNADRRWHLAVMMVVVGGGGKSFKCFTL